MMDWSMNLDISGMFKCNYGHSHVAVVRNIVLHVYIDDNYSRHVHACVSCTIFSRKSPTTHHNIRRHKCKCTSKAYRIIIDKR